MDAHGDALGYPKGSIASFVAGSGPIDDHHTGLAVKEAANRVVVEAPNFGKLGRIEMLFDNMLGSVA